MFQKNQVILERYRMISRAGAGGNAQVLHAYDNVLKRDVAIKCIKVSESSTQTRSPQKREEPELPARAARPRGLPEEPAFLRMREAKAQAQAEARAISKQANSIVDSLPGTIAGAGVAEIGSVDGAAVNMPDLEAPPNENPEISDAPKTLVEPNLPIIGAAAGKASVDELDGKPIAGLEEARAAAKLNDANIVTVYDCVVEDGMAYVVMEYVEGHTLARIMRELKNDITLDMIAAVFTSVSHALEVAHGKNMLHLDIKPENVIVNRDGVVKVTDFGLATLMDTGGHGHTGGGTIGYMPLEQMRLQDLDVRTDEWALASLTYEMLSGSNPFRAGSLKAAESAIENAELVLPSQCWREPDESIDDVMFDALDPMPVHRFPTVKAFSKKLAPMLGDAREGKKQLAKAVAGEIELDSVREPKEDMPREPLDPLIDRLGPKGANIVMRVVAGAGAAMCAAIALLNIRLQTSDAFGLFSSLPIVFWAVLAGLTALSAIKPKFGMPAAFAALGVMFLFNQAWVVGILLIAAAGTWWWFFGRQSDVMCTVTFLQPLFGSFGFSAIVPVMAGVAMDVRDSALSTVMASISALAFAALGSCNIYMWNIAANAITPGSAGIAATNINNAALSTVGDTCTWISIATWIGAAVVYSLFCRKGTRTFDMLGAALAGALLVLGSIGNMLMKAVGFGAWSGATPDVLVLGATITCAIAGVVLAYLNVPDRVRLAEGEW